MPKAYIIFDFYFEFIIFKCILIFPNRHRQHSSGFGNSNNSESAEFQSIIERMASLGPNSQLNKGADENLLL